VGDISLEDLYSAVRPPDALQNGESELVLHPNCGTNYVVSGTLAGIGAVLALFGVGSRKRDWLEPPAAGCQPCHVGPDRRPAPGLSSSRLA